MISREKLYVLVPNGYYPDMHDSEISKAVNEFTNENNIKDSDVISIKETYDKEDESYYIVVYFRSKP